MQPDRFNNRKYGNWVKNSLSLLYLKEGVTKFSNEKAGEFHQKVTERVGLKSTRASRTKCTKCTHKSAITTKAQNKKDVTWRMNCSYNVCSVWLEEILQYHSHLPLPKIAWANSNPQLWPSDVWELAKLFQPYGCENHRKAEDSDCTALLTMMLDCTFFHKFLTNTARLREIKEVRKACMHSRDLEIDDQEIARALDLMVALLEEPYLKNRPECTEAKFKILQLRDNALELSLNKDLEIRALNNKLAEVRADTERDIGRLNDEHQQMKTDLNYITGRQDSTVEECDELRARIAENRQEIAELRKKALEIRALNNMERDIGRLNGEHQQMKTDLNDIKGRQDSTVEEYNELRARMAENRQKMAEYMISYEPKNRPPVDEILQRLDDHTHDPPSPPASPDKRRTSTRGPGHVPVTDQTSGNRWTNVASDQQSPGASAVSRSSSGFAEGSGTSLTSSKYSGVSESSDVSVSPPLTFNRSTGFSVSSRPFSRHSEDAVHETSDFDTDTESKLLGGEEQTWQRGQGGGKLVLGLGRRQTNVESYTSSSSMDYEGSMETSASLSASKQPEVHGPQELSGSPGSAGSAGSAGSPRLTTSLTTASIQESQPKNRPPVDEILQRLDDHTHDPPSPPASPGKRKTSTTGPGHVPVTDQTSGNSWTDGALDQQSPGASDVSTESKLLGGEEQTWQREHAGGKLVLGLDRSQTNAGSYISSSEVSIIYTREMTYHDEQGSMETSASLSASEQPELHGPQELSGSPGSAGSAGSAGSPRLTTSLTTASIQESQLQANKIDLCLDRELELQALQQRQIALDRDLGAQSATLTEVKTKGEATDVEVKTIQSDVDTHSTKLLTVDSDMKSLQEAVTSAKSKNSATELDVKKLTEETKGLELRMQKTGSDTGQMTEADVAGELDEVDSANSKAIPCSSRHELKKEYDDTLNQNQVLELGDKMKSVCAIVYPGGHGTAFRVGDRYLLTAWHVIRDLVNTEGVSLATHTHVKFSVDLKFNATTTIEYKLCNKYIENPALDVAFLEIENPDQNLPQPLRLYGQSIDTNMSSIALIGYGRPENDSTKQLDPGCPVVPQRSSIIQEAQSWLAMNEQQLKNDLESKYKDPNLLYQSYEGYDACYNMIINCYLEKGASGAPFIDYRNPTSMSVVGVLTQGLPKCFWDLPRLSQEKFPHRYRLEVGTRMDSIKAWLMESPNLVSPDLMRQLFP